MGVEFNSLQELYNRLKPALDTKKLEMKRNGYSYIKEEDIWNYLKEIKWKKSVDLELYQMVDDVLNTDSLLIDKYMKDNFAKEKRTINLE